MRFNSNTITRPITTSIIAAFLFSGLSVSAMADNKAALESAVGSNIKVAESSAAVAATPANDDFKKLDLNQDGKVSLKESVKDKVLSGNFDLVDADHDGAVSIEEYASYKSSTAPAKTSAN